MRQLYQPLIDGWFVYIKLCNVNIDMIKTSGTLDELRARLSELSLDTTGKKETLRKRLLKARQATDNVAASMLPSSPSSSVPLLLPKAFIPKQLFRYFVCLDFEATCSEEEQFTYKNEIIEFPAIVVDGETLEIIDEFHSYVRPSSNPVLTTFCTDLTGITQEQVDTAPVFQQVLEKFDAFCDKHSLFTKENPTVWVTDGPWDIRDFINKQVTIDDVPRPKIFNQPYIDLRSAYVYHLHLDWTNLDGMLLNFNLQFEGRPHAGIDDARNVSRILRAMLTRHETTGKKRHQIVIAVNRWVKADGSEWLMRKGKWIKAEPRRV